MFNRFINLSFKSGTLKNSSRLISYSQATTGQSDKTFTGLDHQNDNKFAEELHFEDEDNGYDP